MKKKPKSESLPPPQIVTHKLDAYLKAVAAEYIVSGAESRPLPPLECCVSITMPRGGVLRTNTVLFIGVKAPEGVVHARYSDFLTGNADHFIAAAKKRIEIIAAARCVVTVNETVAYVCAGADVPCLFIGTPPLDPPHAARFVTYHPEWNEASIRAYVRIPTANPNQDERSAIADRITDAVRESMTGAVPAPVVVPVPEVVPPPSPSPVASSDLTGFRKELVLARNSGGEWIPTLSAFDGVPLAIEKVRGDQALYDPRVCFESRVPESGVLILEGGGTYGNHCWLVTRDGKVVSDMSWYRAEEERKLLPIKHLPNVKRITRKKGFCLDLGSNSTHENYAHWLFECVGRLAVLEGSGYGLADFDYIRFPFPKIPRCQEILDLLGIPREKLIVPKDRRTLLQFDRIAKPSIPGLPKQFHPALGDFLHRRAKRPGGGGADKVFLRRTAGARLLLNSDKVEDLLRKRGFTIIDPAVDHAANFSDASVVISPHQAGFADIVFCKPGTKALELLTTDMQSQYYYSASMIGGIDYECLLCPSTHHRGRDARGVSPYNFTADLKAIAEYLDSIEK